MPRPHALHPLRNWQDFEDLCLDLWRLLWDNPGAQKVGRHGQAQDGVDVVGRSKDGGGWVGVQCKLKAPGMSLTVEELKQEVEKARNFQPPLTEYILATTAPRDKAVQKAARILTEAEEEKGGFSVRVVAWQDIEEYLDGYPALVEKYFSKAEGLGETSLSTKIRVAPTASSRNFLAFLSYAKPYNSWVKAFHQHLEATLQIAGEDRHIFLKELDLRSGRSWVGQLQAGLDQAETLVLVATPEALASPRVMDEWQSFIAVCPSWSQGKLHVVMLVECPLPPFLAQIEPVDFTQPGDECYRRGLQKLVAGLLDLAPREVLDLPKDLTAQPLPESELPSSFRKETIAALEPLFASQYKCRSVAASLGLDRKILDGQPLNASAASAALVLATGDDAPRAALSRVLNVLINEMEEEEPATIGRLRELRRKLEATAMLHADQGLLAAYLRKVSLGHQRLVRYFQDNDDIDLLDRVYVQLELQSQRGLRHPEEMSLGKTTFEIHEVLDLDPAEHPWVTRRWVLRGDPGAGKTILLRHLAASEARQGGKKWVPLFDSLPRMLREPEWLFDRLTRQMRVAGHPSEGLAAVLEHEAQQGRLLLLLDGLDEVLRDAREEAVTLLRQLSVRWPNTPILVTSRPIGYESPGESFLELDLLPFNRERRHRFLARWFGRKAGAPDEARATAAVTDLEADSNLRELAGNPLYLTLMALLIEQGTAPSRHRAKLYDQVFDLLLQGKHRKAEELECRAVAREVLRHLAYAMTLENLDAEPLEKLERRLYAPALKAQREVLEVVPLWRQRMLNFLQDIGERTGILGAHDGPEMPWKFLHRTFREALAAEHLEQMYLRDGAASVLEVAKQIAGDESRWAEPYALLAGRIDDPDSLVTALVEANQALGLRAMAMAQGLKRETLEGILELSDKWEERIEVYPRIPELIGDADAALALLDNLRQGTRNGNDLFFLDLALGEVGKSSPDHLQRAEQLRRRLFDHIPAPPEDLFHRIKTEQDGEVDLWRRIPAGRFLMGSPPTEEGHASGEAPQHEVEFLAPFWLSAVAVTQEQFAAFDPEHRSHFVGVQRPVEGVTWYAAVCFCRWLSTVPNLAGARLPKEEEWEYACRGGTTSRFWSGDGEEDLMRVGWCSENSGIETHPVGEKPANPWGLYDVHGNVWEWTVSAWSVDYSDRQPPVKIDPTAGDAADLAVSPATAASVRVFRGGSYRNSARNARSAFRSWFAPGFSFRDLGFRVLLPSSPRL